jgi:hypothetical protein
MPLKIKISCALHQRIVGIRESYQRVMSSLAFLAYITLLKASPTNKLPYREIAILRQQNVNTKQQPQTQNDEML